MKHAGLFLVIFWLFTAASGFSQQASGSEQLLKDIRTIIREDININSEEKSRGNPVPLTWDIVSLVNESKKTDVFKNLGYYLSADFTVTSRPDIKIGGNSGRLEINYGDTVTTKKISKTSKGEYITYDGSKNEESFLIKFMEQDIRFKRNIQTGRFDAYKTANAQNSCEWPLPYLCIYLDRKGTAAPQNSATMSQNMKQVPVNLSDRDQIPVLIMGKGRLSGDVIVSYIMSKSVSMTRQQIEALVGTYVREAREEGINHDIAIAQMCYATKFLSNRQLLFTHNYAGLNTDMGISVRHGSTHPDMYEGVLAHIQHLKGYASRERPKSEIVNRRYYLLVDKGIQGTVTTLEDLFSTWSPQNARYGNEIIKILKELYRFSGRYS